MARIDILDFDLAAAEHAGKIRAEFAFGGQLIGPFDVRIAGYARSRGLCLVPNNFAKFERFSGLRLVTWVE